MRGLPAAAPDAGWRARLELGFAPTPGPQARRTRLVRAEHSGPLQVQRPFYPERDGTCHVVILHPPGGVVGGDRLRLDAALAGGCGALLTTPSAARFYRSAGAAAVQEQTFRVAPGAGLEWLPQETILFEGARVTTTTRIELAGDARCLAWEITCLGRPAAGEGFARGALDQRIELWRDGAPLYLERSRVTGGSEAQAAAWGFGGEAVCATLLATVDAADACDAARERLGDAAGRCAATQCDGLLLLRYRGPSAAEARARFIAVWQALRPAVLGKAAVLPRIWHS